MTGFMSFEKGEGPVTAGLCFCQSGAAGKEVAWALPGNSARFYVRRESSSGCQSQYAFLL